MLYLDFKSFVPYGNWQFVLAVSINRHYSSCTTWCQVNPWMGDRLRASKPSCCVISRLGVGLLSLLPYVGL